jgi:hypothetical protein
MRANGQLTSSTPTSGTGEPSAMWRIPLSLLARGPPVIRSTLHVERDSRTSGRTEIAGTRLDTLGDHDLTLLRHSQTSAMPRESRLPYRWGT